MAIAVATTLADGFGWLALAAGCCTAGGASAQDWPQWRGPSRDGVAPCAGLPADWPAQPPRAQWKVRVGEGCSSPAVARGRVFIMGREDNQEACLCLDAASGKTIWRHAYPVSYRPPDPRAGRGPQSTPTVDDDRVYALGVRGMFHCLDAATGRVLWKHDLAAEYWGVVKDAEGDDAWAPCCGSAASPLVDGERVILPVGGPKAGAITAFDRRTGQVVWKALGDRGSYASPVVAALAGVRQVIGYTGRRMVGLKADDGTLLWEHPYRVRFEQTILTPVLWRGLVIFGGDQDKRKDTQALRVERKDGPFAVTVAWRNDDLRCYVTTPVVVGDHLIGLNRRQQLVCVALATGKTAWVQAGFGRYVSLVVAGGQLLVLDEDGSLHVLAADARRFARLAKWRLSEAGDVWAHLAVANGRLFVKDKYDLECFDLAAR